MYARILRVLALIELGRLDEANATSQRMLGDLDAVPVWSSHFYQAVAAGQAAVGHPDVQGNSVMRARRPSRAVC